MGTRSRCTLSGFILHEMRVHFHLLRNGSMVSSTSGPCGQLSIACWSISASNRSLAGTSCRQVMRVARGRRVWNGEPERNVPISGCKPYRASARFRQPQFARLDEALLYNPRATDNSLAAEYLLSPTYHHVHGPRMLRLTGLWGTPRMGHAYMVRSDAGTDESATCLPSGTPRRTGKSRGFWRCAAFRKRLASICREWRRNRGTGSRGGLGESWPFRRSPVYPSEGYSIRCGRSLANGSLGHHTVNFTTTCRGIVEVITVHNDRCNVSLRSAVSSMIG